ncbi:MAG: hypothetical protein JW938_04875 [Candidatus Omnitrophica bacterium]|nr:hypothetical protein [Candidatus Omnitrophota bacterium]
MRSILTGLVCLMVVVTNTALYAYAEEHPTVGEMKESQSAFMAAEEEAMQTFEEAEEPAHELEGDAGTEALREAEEAKNAALETDNEIITEDDAKAHIEAVRTQAASKKPLDHPAH